MYDLEKPQHFTKEQSKWIKAYVILKRKEERAEVIDLIDRHLWNYSHEVWEDFQPILKQLKENKWKWT